MTQDDMGEFAPNEAGAALDRFVTDYMERRLAPCRKDTE